MNEQQLMQAYQLLRQQGMSHEQAKALVVQAAQKAYQQQAAAQQGQQQGQQQSGASGGAGAGGGALAGILGYKALGGGSTAAAAEGAGTAATTAGVANLGAESSALANIGSGSIPSSFTFGTNGVAGTGAELGASGTTGLSPSLMAAAPYAGVAAGALGALRTYKKLGEESRDKSALSGGLSGAAGGAGIGTLIAPGVGTAIGAGLGALLGGGLGYGFGGKSTAQRQLERRNKLLKKGVAGYQNAYDISKQPDTIDRKALGETYQGETPEANGQKVWVNNKFAKTGDEADLRVGDLVGQDLMYELYGDDYMGRYNTQQRNALAKAVLDAGVRNARGMFDLTDKNKKQGLLDYGQSLLSGQTKTPTYGFDAGAGPQMTNIMPNINLPAGTDPLSYFSNQSPAGTKPAAVPTTIAAKQSQPDPGSIKRWRLAREKGTIPRVSTSRR
jgi:hypothetical protein